ncbi:MAG: LacI family DNA-binding transcriptional regulator, partial [Planctomycetota bacterium]
SFFADIYHGVEDAISAAGYRAVVTASDYSAEKEQSILSDFRDKGVEGVVMAPVYVGRTKGADEMLQELIADGFPVTFVDVTLPGYDVDFVTSDNKHGGYLAARHLLQLGHRRIGFVVGVDCSSVRGRIEGYQKALAEAEIEYDDLLIKRSYIGFTGEDSGCRNARELLHMSDPPTAIMTSSDCQALGVYRMCYEMGVDIPDGISVVGYNDLPYTNSLVPPLTTVRQPKYEMGKTAGELLLRRIRGEADGPEKVVLENEFVERSSCGAQVVGAADYTEE